MHNRDTGSSTVPFFGRTIKRSTGSIILMVGAAAIFIPVMAAAALFGDKDIRGDNMAVFYFGKLYGYCQANELSSMPTVSCEILPATPSLGVRILEASDDELYYKGITYTTCGIEKPSSDIDHLVCVRL